MTLFCEGILLKYILVDGSQQIFNTNRSHALMALNSAGRCLETQPQREYDLNPQSCGGSSRMLQQAHNWASAFGVLWGRCLTIHDLCSDQTATTPLKSHSYFIFRWCMWAQSQRFSGESVELFGIVLNRTPELKRLIFYKQCQTVWAHLKVFNHEPWA